ncbi:MAG: thioredoxin family protein [Roseovarius sp.]|uniref:thioredoxin family protein n=1 Tax=Roseovarius sp. TaxID=1486281 RepID=UPI0040599150
MRNLTLLAALLLGAATSVVAQDLPQQSRTALGEAIRAVLIDTPTLLALVMDPAPLTGADLYGDEAARDLDLLAQAAPRLFAPGLPGFGAEGATPSIAFFTQTDCPDCATAEAELRDIAARLGLRVNVFDLTENTTLVTTLGLDMAPSYVLPDMMLRGAMPAIVLEKYLRR